MKTTIKLNPCGVSALKARGLADNKMLSIINQDGDSPEVSRLALRWLCIQVLGQYGYKFEVADNATPGK